MDYRDLRYLVVCFILFSILMFGLGYCSGRNGERYRWKQECIERNVAGYNKETGDWEWITDKEK